MKKNSLILMASMVVVLFVLYGCFKDTDNKQEEEVMELPALTNVKSELIANNYGMPYTCQLF